MYFILDIALIFITVVAVVLGLKRGFIDSCFNIFGYVLFLGVSAVVALGLTTLAYKCGSVDALAIVIYRVIGLTNSFFNLIGITSNQIALCISVFLVFVVCFVISYVVLMFFFKYVANTLERLREDKLFKIVDSVLGIVFNLFIVAAFVTLSFSVVYALAEHGVATYLSEIVRACPLSGFIYRHNPLKEAFMTLNFTFELK